MFNFTDRYLCNINIYIYIYTHMDIHLLVGGFNGLNNTSYCSSQLGSFSQVGMKINNI